MNIFRANLLSELENLLNQPSFDNEKRDKLKNILPLMSDSQLEELFGLLKEKFSLIEDAKVLINDVLSDDLIKNENTGIHDIAITGIAVKASLAENKTQFWHNLRKGNDLIRNLPEGRKKDLERYLDFEHKREKIDSINIRSGYLEEIDKFDYSRFRLSPKEASLMDPNQRLFLEVAYDAIDDAGEKSGSMRAKTGLYVGFFPVGKKYGDMVHELAPADSGKAVLGNIEPVMSDRISYLLNLSGPSMLINTACSSSLSAVHLACRAIQRGDCDQAIAGGIKLNIFPFKEFLY